MSGSSDTDQTDDGALLACFHTIASGDADEVARLLDATPALAVCPIRTGASRQDPDTYFLSPIVHYVYAGDTALHIAAAAHLPAVAQSLINNGAQPRARNRRGAQPLHYAADARPGEPTWGPADQSEVIDHLIASGSDPDARDASGVAAIHRAVRTRGSAAVRTLLANGADALLKNKSGSTPLHLAVQTTGSSGSGSTSARDEQRQIIVVLLQHGARPDDTDAKGRTVRDAATSSWIVELLDSA